MICGLCQREVAEVTAHHLIPKSENGGGKEMVMLCRTCHKMIHSLFANRQLAREFHTLSRLKKHPDMKRFLRWVKKQDPNKRIKVRSKGEK